MPELPEVETTCRGLTPLILHKTIQAVVLRHHQLRYPLSHELQLLNGQRFTSLTRRGKYLIFTTEQQDHVLMHLGMSGSVRLLKTTHAPQKHDHLDIVFHDQSLLRYHDPRRFGLWLWLGQMPAEHHPLLAKLGPEPLSDAFNGDFLYQRTRHSRVAIKKWLMNAQAVVGVGNIYAAEALFMASVSPLKPALNLTLPEAHRLVAEIKNVLLAAIKAGGTTLKDFSGSDGKPGYFAVHLHVYGRGGQACYRCTTLLTELRLDNRSTVYCQKCQR